MPHIRTAGWYTAGRTVPDDAGADRNRGPGWVGRIGEVGPCGPVGGRVGRPNQPAGATCGEGAVKFKGAE